MVRRVTPAQFDAMRREQVRKYNQEVDRVNRANKKAVDDYNRHVRRHNDAVNREISARNQNAQRAVAKYNQAVRAHNTKVRSDRTKLQQQINALRSRPTNSAYANVQASTYDLHDHYERIAQQPAYSDVYGDLVALSERESGNSVSVTETLLDTAPGDTPAEEATEDTGIIDYLSGFSQDLCDRWRGAVFALNPINPDAGRHFCTSAREIFTEILERWAQDEEVIAADPDCQRTPQGKPTRRAKITYLLARRHAATSEMIGFVEADIDNIVQLFGVFNEATHGEAGRHGFAKLRAIRQRVAGGIMFLAAVAT
jgi:hypothetical protein